MKTKNRGPQGGGGRLDQNGKEGLGLGRGGGVPTAEMSAESDRNVVRMNIKVCHDGGEEYELCLSSKRKNRAR